MIRTALMLTVTVLCLGCGDEETAEPRACPLEAIARQVESNAFALHDAPDWTLDLEYTPQICYGSLDCSGIDSDDFYFQAPVAGRYRFSTDFGALYFSGKCGGDPEARDTAEDGEGGFNFRGTHEFEVALAAGEFIAGVSFQWTDTEWEDEPSTYNLRVDLVEE